VLQRDPHLRKTALEVLLAHPYAADDLLNSPAWQPFCAVLPSLLADACTETAAAAASFAGCVFREVKRSSPQQLAQLCTAIAASVTIDNACTASAPAQHAGRSLHAGSSAAKHASSSAADTAGLDRAATQAAVLKLLVAVLEALPKVWASFRPPLLQQLWDAVCPLLYVKAGVNRASSAEPTAAVVHAHAQQAEAGCQLTSDAAVGTRDRAVYEPNGKAQAASGSGLAQAFQHRSGAVSSCTARPLAALYRADEGCGHWWRMWTAPAASAKVQQSLSETMMNN
jgi:hypothetical protein